MLARIIFIICLREQETKATQAKSKKAEKKQINLLPKFIDYLASKWRQAFAEADAKK